MAESFYQVEQDRPNYFARPFCITYPNPKPSSGWQRLTLLNAQHDPRRFATRVAAQKIADKLNQERQP